MLNTSDNVTVQCHTPRVIIQTVATEDITASISQAELTVDSDIHSSDFPEPPDALEADTFPDEIHQPKVTVEPSFNDAHISKFSDQNSTELMNSVMVRTEDLKQEESPSHLARAYVTEVSCTEGNGLWVLTVSSNLQFEKSHNLWYLPFFFKHKIKCKPPPLTSQVSDNQQCCYLTVCH